MKLPLAEKNDIKIFILYLMRNIGYPLDFNSISDIVIQDGIVGYFDFAECFAELVDAETIEARGSGADLQYSVSEKGLHIAEELSNGLLAGIREKSLTSALRHLSFKKRGAVLKTMLEELDSGRYRVRCTIREKEEYILDVSVTAESEAQAAKIVDNFNRRPEVAFRGVLALLSGEVDYLFES